MSESVDKSDQLRVISFEPHLVQIEIGKKRGQVIT